MRRVMPTIAVLYTLTVGGAARQPALAFDVASIKPATQGGRSSALLDPQPSGYSAFNVTLASLIRLAYGLNPYQVVGGPDWVYRDRFTVTAKYPVGWSLERSGGKSDALRMLQNLLADRFTLRVRRDTREGITYTLVLARQDGRLGAGLRPSRACARSASDAKENGGAPCTTLLGRSAVEVNGQPLSYLASSLAMMIGAPVIDRTGLSGTYDAQAKWTPTESTGDLSPDHVPLFIAIEEQLGLKLQRGRGTFDVIVIDSAKPPTPD